MKIGARWRIDFTAPMSVDGVGCGLLNTVRSDSGDYLEFWKRFLQFLDGFRGDLGLPKVKTL